MIVVLLGCAVFVAVFFPETASGKLLRRIFIEYPAEKLNRLTWARVLFAVAVILAIAGMIDLMGRDGLQLIGVALPEAIAWFVTFDIATYMDVLVLAWALSSLMRVRSLVDAARARYKLARRWLAIRVRKARRVRTRRSRVSAKLARKNTDKGKNPPRPLPGDVTWRYPAGQLGVVDAFSIS